MSPYQLDHLLPPSPEDDPEDDSSRRLLSEWFAAASDKGRLVREGQEVEKSAPRAEGD